MERFKRSKKTCCISSGMLHITGLCKLKGFHPVVDICKTLFQEENAVDELQFNNMQ
jgi:hypothetical protein